MKILVISDTHNYLDGVFKIIERERGIDHIIHLGDHVKDAEDLNSIYEDITIDYVRGNTDYLDHEVKETKILELQEKKFFITHGHNYHVKSTIETLIKNAEHNEVDIALFGHTHVPLLQKHGEMYVMNPGSAAGIRISGCTYGIIEVTSGKDLKVKLDKI